MSAKRPPKAAILIDCKKEKEGRKEGRRADRVFWPCPYSADNQASS
jgi:hypothetical protein